MRIFTFLLFLFLFGTTSIASNKDTLSIVTWNIYMRPRFIMHNNQVERAREIVNAVQNDSMDIIVFEEIFDKKARRIISHGLKSIYKYTAGPGKMGFFRLNCGVMIFSKYKVASSKVVFYNDCKSADCLAKKAVIYTEIQIKENKKFNLLGTHLQAIEGNVYRKVRERQLNKMQKLSEKNKQENVPTVFAGDFNITERDSLFQNLLSIFKVKQLPVISKRKFSSDNDNTYKQGDTGGSLIDHIFLNENQTGAVLENMEVIRKEYSKNGKNYDLSDHYLVKAKLIY